jgi:hypothetical protein
MSSRAVRRIALALASLALLAGLAAVAAGFARWDAGALAGEALARLESEAGWSLEVGEATLVPLRGLTLEGVTGTVRTSAGAGELVAERILLEHRPAALLSGRLELRRLVLVGPRLSLVEPPPPAPREASPSPLAEREASTPKPPAPPPPVPEPPPPYEGPVRFDLLGVRVEGGSLLVGPAGRPATLRVEGLDLELDAPSVVPEQRRSLLRALSSRGRFRAEEAALAVGRLSGVEGELGIEDGRLSVSGLGFSNDHGDFVADVEVQLGTAPLRHHVVLRADPLDLHPLVGSPERGLLGSAKLSVDVRGAGTGREALSGRGTIELAPGRLPSFPILNHLEAGLRRVSLREAEHGPVTASFAVGDGRLDFEPFVVRAAELTVAGDGSVGLDGELDLALTLSASRDAISLRGVPDELVELLTVEGGRLSIPVEVRGTTDSPRARADHLALAERARARGLAVDEAALRGQLDELFGLEPS